MRSATASLALLWAGGLVAAACHEPSRTPPPAIATVAATTAAGGASAEGAAGHGSHDPKHGGVVLMYGELHYEIVLDRGGRHRLYFSDLAREDLPASTASEAYVTVKRPGDPDELIRLDVSDDGESWKAEGRPVTPVNATARIGFRVAGQAWWTDVPFEQGAAR